MLNLKLQPLVSDTSLWKFNYYLGLVGQEKTYEELRNQLKEDTCLKDNVLLETIEKGNFSEYIRLINEEGYFRTAYKSIDRLLAVRQYCKYDYINDGKDYLKFVKYFLKNKEEIVYISSILSLNSIESKMLSKVYDLFKPLSTKDISRTTDSIMDTIDNEITKSQLILNETKYEIGDEFFDKPVIPSDLSKRDSVYSPLMIRRQQNYKNSITSTFS